LVNLSGSIESSTTGFFINGASWLIIQSIFSQNIIRESNIEALREVYPNVSLGCFIKKPVSIEYLVKRLSAELD
jgi:hypothetical protein